MNKILLGALAMAGLMLASGCRIPSSGIVVESYPQTQITINSKLVAGRVQIAEYNAAKRNNLLNAQITVQNITKRDVQFEYRYRWQDRAGMDLASASTTWIPISLAAKERSMLNAIASSREAEDFIFEIRFSRPSSRW